MTTMRSIDRFALPLLGPHNPLYLINHSLNRNANFCAFFLVIPDIIPIIFHQQSSSYLKMSGSHLERTGLSVQMGQICQSILKNHIYVSEATYLDQSPRITSTTNSIIYFSDLDILLSDINCNIHIRNGRFSTAQFGGLLTQNLI